MKNEIIMLIDLQSFEEQIFELNNSIKQIPLQIDAIEDELSDSKKEVENIENTIAEIKKKYGDFELTIKDNISRIKKNDLDLMAIKTNKEYNAVLKAIDDLKNANSDMEDKMIAYLEQLEDKNKDLKASKEKMAQAVKKSENKKSALQKEIAQKEEKLQIAIQKKNAKLIEIPPDIIKIYNNVKKIRGNKVIVNVEEGVCKGCNLNISVQQYINIQKSESINFCPNCHRIIYYEAPSTTDQVVQEA